MLPWEDTPTTGTEEHGCATHLPQRQPLELTLVNMVYRVEQRVSSRQRGELVCDGVGGERDVRACDIFFWVVCTFMQDVCAAVAMESYRLRLETRSY